MFWLLQWTLKNVLENRTFQRIAKVIIVDFYEMDIVKGIVISAKVDEMYNILKFASHWLLAERYDGNGWLFAGQLQRKKLILQYRWHWNTLIRRSKKIEMDENRNFQQRFVNATKWETSSKRISWLIVYFDMK